jgi:hypothetical protein
MCFRVLVLATTLASPLALAADDPAPTVKVSGVVFAHYGVDLTEGADLANSFDLDRTYLKVDGAIGEHWGTRLTLDASREPTQTVSVPGGPGGVVDVEIPEDRRFRVFVKHAWLEYRSPAAGVKLRLGMADTAYLPFFDGFWGYRWVTKGAADDFKLQNTADLGVHGVGEHADGLVSWQASVVNGEGFASPEADAGKTVAGRFTLDPLASNEDNDLPVTVFVQEHLVTDGDPTLTAIGALGFRRAELVAWGEFAVRNSGAVTGSGFSVVAVPRVPDVAALILKVDRFDPDHNADDDATIELLGGLTHDFAKNISLGATYELALVQAAPDVPTHGVFARMQAGF